MDQNRFQEGTQPGDAFEPAPPQHIRIERNHHNPRTIMTVGERTQFGCHPFSKVNRMLLGASKGVIRIVWFNRRLTIAVAPDRQVGATVTTGRQVQWITDIPDPRRDDLKRRINCAQQCDQPAGRHPAGTHVGHVRIGCHARRIDNKVARAIQTQRLVYPAAKTALGQPDAAWSATKQPGHRQGSHIELRTHRFTARQQWQIGMRRGASQRFDGSVHAQLAQRRDQIASIAFSKAAQNTLPPVQVETRQICLMPLPLTLPATQRRLAARQPLLHPDHKMFLNDDIRQLFEQHR
jgi:hypothetical protein